MLHACLQMNCKVAIKQDGSFKGHFNDFLNYSILTVFRYLPSAIVQSFSVAFATFDVLLSSETVVDDVVGVVVVKASTITFLTLTLTTTSGGSLDMPSQLSSIFEENSCDTICKSLVTKYWWFNDNQTITT